MIGRFGYLSPFGALPNVGEQSFLGGLRTERKVRSERRKDKPKLKRIKKCVSLAAYKRRRRKLAKASKIKNRK